MGGPNGAYSIVDNGDPVKTSLSVDDMLPIFTDYYAVLDSAKDIKKRIW